VINNAGIGMAGNFLDTSTRLGEDPARQTCGA